MTSDRWHQIEEIFLQAAQLPEHERAAFIEQSCGDDQELKSQVNRLLEADDVADAYIDEFGDRVLGPAMAAAFEARDTLLGSLVGPYRVERRIGTGGMGNVYRATRADGAFEQTVALKVVRIDLRPELRARFFAERQILARLQHPGIARVYDGGLTEDGRPWLAMEYVDGQPITQFADENRLPVNHRLDLFAQVCAAVSYAHQNLIVHRDLKPSNILVTEAGEVKLLDFGIARLLEDESETGLTVLGAGPMTPEYAAPEQVQGAAITVATDVYALGVLLYELLTGRRPYRLPSRVRHEVERVILEEEPTRPSTAAQQPIASGADPTADTTPETLSEVRGVDPPGLRRRLSGDLDVIILKALRKDPALRYGSAQSFSEDIDRHLNGQPVSARPPTLLYRADRFVRRNRWGVVAALTIFLLLVGYAVTVTQQSRTIAEERDRASIEARKAEEVSSFLVSLFVANEPAVAQGAVLSARDLLEQGALRTIELAHEPEVQAELQAVIGRAYLQLAHYDEADSLLSAAYDAFLRLNNDGSKWNALSDVLNNRATLAHARGQLDEAEALMLEALTLRDSYRDEGADMGRLLSNLGTINSHKGRYDDSEEFYRRGIKMLAAELGSDDPDHLAALVSLGVTLRQKNAHEEAEAVYREAIANYRTRDDLHPGMATALNNLGMLLHSQGQGAEAMPYLEEAYEIRSRVLGPEHPETTGILHNRGLAAQSIGDLQRAAELLRDALNRWEDQLGPDHVNVGIASKNLADVIRDDGALAESVPYYQRAIEIFRRALAPDHSRTAGARIGLGMVFLRQDDLGRAEPEIRAGAEVFAARMPSDAFAVFGSRGNLGEVLLKQGRYEEAEPLLLDAARGFETRSGPDAPTTQRYFRFLVDLYDALGDHQKAEEFRARLSE